MSENSQVNILVVEDEDLDAKIIANGLLRIKNPIVKVYRVVDGVSALELLRKDDPEVYIHNSPIIIVLDLNLPRMNGIELLRELRADSKLDDVIVFILTTSSSDYEINEAYQLNAAGYFVKANAGPLYRDFFQMIAHYLPVVSLKR